jgi:hypothetical protein
VTPTTIPVEVRLAYRDCEGDAFVSVEFAGWMLCEWRPTTGWATVPASILSPVWCELPADELSRLTTLAHEVWAEASREPTP